VSLSDPSLKITSVDQIPLVNALILHLLPGVLIVIFDIIFFPIVESANFPTLFTLILANLIILIPFELGFLIYASKKNHNSFNVLESVPLREKLPALHFIAYVAGLFVWGLLVFMLFMPVNSVLADFFTWMPEGFFSTDIDNLQDIDFKATYSSTTLLIVLTVSLVVNGIGVPVVEELYFRGYLLPRISRFLVFAPLINVTLWALYHFWAPWTIVANIFVFFPAAYIVLRTRNVYISIIGHGLSNIFLVISLVPLML
jgi:membrane protease YdiL (CAAX protease family)